MSKKDKHLKKVHKFLKDLKKIIKSLSPLFYILRFIINFFF